jgi:L-seryl-tRNA(Ser) seleniumtransferase
MDVEPETWTWRARYLESSALPGPPHHGLGRPMKVGKEEIAGLMTALERYVARDHQAEWQGWYRMLASMQERLAGLPGVAVEILINRREPQAVPVARIQLDEVMIEQTAVEVVNRLMAGHPAVAVSQGYLHESALGINPMVLQPGEDEIVIERIRAVIGGS